jgi:hypothetical protein
MRKIVACSVLTVLLCVSLGSADLVKARMGETKQTLAAGMTRSYVDTFKKNERALVIASGIGASCMGLYVFDSQGNCLAKDDLSAPATADDLIVEWYPTEPGRYCVDLRNAGFENNQYQIILR